jgi:hypothetical protein
MEGCLLATRQVTWLVRNYAAIGVLSIVATQVLLSTDIRNEVLQRLLLVEGCI